MTTFEYRPLPEDRSEEYDRILGYAFSPEDGPPDRDESDDDESDDQEVGERRGMFDGDDLLAVCRQIYWETDLRGVSVDLAGLSAVGSPPESRRKGVVSEMVAASIDEYRDRGCEFAALWPFKRSFYERYGYGTANRRAMLECPAEDLAFADDRSAGEFRPASEDDWETLDRVYREHADRFSLSLERDERWWRKRVFRSWGSEPYAYVYERDGRAVAYVVYTVEDGDEDEGRTLKTRELAWTDPGAFEGLLRFAYYHDSQVETVTLGTHPSSPLDETLDRIEDPDYHEVTYQVWPGPMVRIVDVVDALESLRYPGGVTETLRLSVSDPVAEVNDGQFRLDVADGTATCRRVDGGADSPDVECSIAALSQAAVGYQSVETLGRTATLRGTPDGLDALAEMFPPDEVYLRDFF